MSLKPKKKHGKGKRTADKPYEPAVWQLDLAEGADKSPPSKQPLSKEVRDATTFEHKGQPDKKIPWGKRYGKGSAYFEPSEAYVARRISIVSEREATQSVASLQRLWNGTTVTGRKRILKALDATAKRAYFSKDNLHYSKKEREETKRVGIIYGWALHKYFPEEAIGGVHGAITKGDMVSPKAIIKVDDHRESVAKRRVKR